MATPKKKISKARGGSRRSQTSIKKSSLTECKNCGEIKRPHHVCLSCGSYNGKNVVKPAETK